MLSLCDGTAFCLMSEQMFTFSDLSVDFEVVRGEDVVDPPRESPLLLFNPPLVIEHVLGSERHRVSRYGCKEQSGCMKQNKVLRHTNTPKELILQPPAIKYLFAWA